MVSTTNQHPRFSPPLGNFVHVLNIQTSDELVSSYYSNTIRFAAQLAAIITCPDCRGNSCCTLVTLLHFAFQTCKKALLLYARVTGLMNILLVLRVVENGYNDRAAQEGREVRLLI